jgi:hypothetical protein
MKWKSLAVYVLCCFLLCNSVLADFETIVDGDGVDSNNDIGISDVPDSSVPDVAPPESGEPDVSEGGLDEDFTVGETVDSVVDSVSDLVNSATSETAPGESVSQVSPGGNTVYVLTQPDSEVVRDVTPTPVSIDDPGVTITDISLSSVAPVTPSSTSGLKSALLGILGNYDPVIVEYQYQSSQGYNNYLREVQPDYVWLCSAALLALVIYCLFKLGGGLIRG